MMKNFLKCILLGVGMFILTSCEKFLDKPPHDLSPLDYYNTESELTAAIAGVYDRLAGVYGTTWLYRLGHEADEGFYARSNLPVGPQNFNFTATHNDVAGIWSTLYSGIFRANLVLKNVDKNPAIAQSARNRIRGEALFLRGHFYFVLVQLYGGVPLILEATSDSNADMNIPRSSVAQVYAQILSDMEAAESLVPPITAIGHGGRISKSAVRGILARVNLYMAGYPLRDISRYPVARAWADSVITDAQAAHALNPDFTDIFINYARDEYDIKESIFEVEYWGNRTDTYTETGYAGFANGPITSNAATGNGFGGVKATAKLYKKYKTGDLRRDWTIANFTYSNTGVSGTKTPITSVAEGALYSRDAAKWRREYETLIPKATGQTPQNFPLLRYSDVLLIYAEADFYASGVVNPVAVDYVNLVKRRGFGKLMPGATNIAEHDIPYTIDEVDFETEIKDERMREFAFEQMRKFDLIRWNSFVGEMNSVVQMMNVVPPSSTAYAKTRFVNGANEIHLLWPIPGAEIMMNNAIVQNPNW